MASEGPCGTRLLLYLGVTWLASCGDPRFVLEAALPPDIRWVAALAAERGSGLVESDGIFALTLPEGTEGEIAILGWTDAQLTEIVDEARARDRSFSPGANPIKVVGQSDPALPQAAFFGRSQLPSQVVERIEEAAPSVGAEWLRPCPVLEPRGVDFDCLGVSCGATLRQLGCSFEISTETCPLLELGGAIDGRGRVSLSDPSLGLCVSEAGAEPIEAVCSGSDGPMCKVVLHRPPSEPYFEAKTVSIVEPTAFNDMDGGVIGGLVDLGDRLVVSTFAGGSARCEAAASFVRLSPETLEVLAETPAPACARHLVADPVGSGFLAVTSTGSPRLERFDADGRSLESVRIDTSIPRPFWVRSLSASPSTVALFISPPNATGFSSRVLGFDPVTLELENSIEGIFNDQSGALTEDKSGKLYVVDDRGSVTWYEARTLRRLGGFATCGSGAPQAIAVTEEGVAIAIRGGNQGLLLTPLDGQFCIRHSFWEWFGTPLDVRPGLGGLWVMLDQRKNANSPRGPVAVAVAARGRGFQPGAIVVGEGIGRWLQVRDEGVGFVALPWTGAVARIVVRGGS